MREHIELFREEDRSITVEMDLQHYLPLFLRSNGHGRPLNSKEQETFNNKLLDFNEHFAGVGAEDLMEDIKELLLQKYSAEEKVALQASPAFNLIYDAYTEIFKNAIDVFLEQHMEDPSNASTKVALNINVEKFYDQVNITFSDSGPGFPKPILDKLNTEKSQLEYSEEHQGSQKRAAKCQGMMGGGGRGLRNIVALVLSGEPLHPGKKVRRASHFESEIHFTNGNNPYCPGACIDIATQLAPIPVLGHTRPYSSDSKASRGTLSDLSSGHTSSLSELSIDTDSSDFSGASPELPKKKLGLDLTIDLDDLIPNDTSHFASDSPVIQKKPNSSKLFVETEDHTDISSLSGISTEIQAKSQAAKSINPKDISTAHRLAPISHPVSPIIQPRKTQIGLSPRHKSTDDHTHHVSGKKATVPQQTGGASKSTVRKSRSKPLTLTKDVSPLPNLAAASKKQSAFKAEIRNNKSKQLGNTHSSNRFGK